MHKAGHVYFCTTSEGMSEPDACAKWDQDVEAAGPEDGDLLGLANDQFWLFGDSGRLCGW